MVPAVYHPAATQHAFERVTTQELFHHLCIAHFRATGSGLSIPPVHGTPAAASLSHTHGWQGTRSTSQSVKNFSGMCCFSLATSSRCCQEFPSPFLPFVVQVTEAQACPSVVMSHVGKPLLVASSDNDPGSVPYFALRLSSSTCTHASIFPPDFQPPGFSTVNSVVIW